MSQPGPSAAVATQVRSVATIVHDRGTSAAVAYLQAPVATAAAAQGPAGPPGKDADAVARTPFVQAEPAAVWTIPHGLNRYPGIVLIDTAGDAFDGDARYLDENTMTITFNAPQAGTAWLI